MIEAIKDRWHERYSNKLLEQAKRESHHATPRLTFRLAITWLLSVIVLTSPFIVALLGAALIYTTFPRVLPVIVGVILLGFAYILVPRRGRNLDRTYTRAEFPKLFELLDEISDRLNTPPPDGVHLNAEFNAYMTQFRRPFSRDQEWVVGIGFPLWAACSPDEKIALMAHELSHKVNDDPMRQGVFLQAEIVLANWFETFTSDAGDEFGGHLFQIVVAWMIKSYYRLLSGFSFFESQRAEYRADAYAATVSGKSAMCDLLEIFTRADLHERAIVDLYPYRDNQNGRIFDHMAKAVASADPATVDRFLKEAAEKKRRIDESHPPTAMRLEFIRSLPDEWGADQLDPAAFDFEAIDAELQSAKDALGKEMMEDLYEMEVNR